MPDISILCFLFLHLTITYMKLPHDVCPLKMPCQPVGLLLVPERNLLVEKRLILVE